MLGVKHLQLTWAELPCVCRERGVLLLANNHFDVDYPNI